MPSRQLYACLLLAGASTCVVDGLHAPAAIRSPVFAPRPRLAVLSAVPQDGAAANLAARGEASGSTELVAATPAEGDPRRVAVSGLQPKPAEGEQQQYVGVPPPGSVYDPAPSPTFMQKARGPFMGLTVLATAAIATWQSKRLYNRRQNALLDEFAATMVFHLGDEREMVSCLRSFRSQLGPGRYTGSMYTSFLKAMASNVPIGVKAINDLKTADGVFGLSESASGKLLGQAADELGRQPSVLGKLTFLSERAMPGSAASAMMRTKFPNWSFDTVTALQRAMLENLYRELIEEDLDAPCAALPNPPCRPCAARRPQSSPGGRARSVGTPTSLPRPLSPSRRPDGATLATLGLSESEAARLTQEVKERKEEEAREIAEKEAEEKRARELEAALMAAAKANKMPVRSTKLDDVDLPPPSAPPSAPSDDDDGRAPPAPSDDAASDDLGVGPLEVPADGTHEYECTKCGYVLFPAAGREFKFFGADFTCPQCNCDRSEFVDNGPVE